jgi:putative ABC transport system permease protein
MDGHIRAAMRSLRHRPALSMTVVLTLGLGIGANSAIFSVVDAVLLRPLPYPQSDRLVNIYERNLASTVERQATQLVAPGRLEEWNAANRSFDGLAASYFENMTDMTGQTPERVEARRTSPRFFSVLGVAAAVGRTPTPDEERFGGPAVAVISDAFWDKRFGRDPNVVGRQLRIGGGTATVIGVMPPRFAYPTTTTDLWRPTQAPKFFLDARAARLYTAFGRMKPAVTIEQALDDLNAVEARLGEQFPQTDRGWGAALVAMKEDEVGGVRRSLWFLLAAVGLVLLTACSNVACLMLADGARRGHEMAVRFALGADRRRLVGQLLVEGTLLAAAGACAGLLIGAWGLNGLRAAATDLPRIGELRIDLRLVALTLTIGIATTLLFALAPALQTTRHDAANALSRGGRGHVGGHHGLQQALVASQIALAIVLLVGAGLLIRSFMRMQEVSPGFDPDRVVTFRMSAQWSERIDAVVQRHARTINRLNAIPGVEASAFSQQPPAGITIPPGEFHVVGRDPNERTFSTVRSVSAGYFRTLHIPIVEGDTCSGDPAAPLYGAALVTRAFVDRFFRDEDPIGHAFTSQGMSTSLQTRIIGVVGDVRENGLLKDPEPLIYYCGFNPYWPDPYFLVRTTATHPATMNEIRAALREIEPARAVYAVRLLVDLLADSTSQQRINAILIACFAATAVLLASMGLYGVLSQVVQGRQREIAVRIALGARAAQILGSVVGNAAVLTAAGIAAGLVIALAASRVMTTLVFGVSARDPITFALVPIVLAMVAVATALVPASRATRVDPMRALRAD